MLGTNHEEFEAFWAHYLKSHEKPATRVVHYVSVAFAAGLSITAVGSGNVAAALGAVVAMTVPPALAHRFLEFNRPTSRKQPVWSLLCTIRMCSLALRRRLRDDLDRHGVI
jgi:hypothetical protein